MTGTGLLVCLLVMLVLAAVFAMLNWFAPALVALRGAPAIEAMKLSFLACLRNWVPFLVYGLIVVVAVVMRWSSCSSRRRHARRRRAHERQHRRAASARSSASFILLFVGVDRCCAVIVGPIVVRHRSTRATRTRSTTTTRRDNPAYGSDAGRLHPTDAARRAKSDLHLVRLVPVRAGADVGHQRHR